MGQKPLDWSYCYYNGWTYNNWDKIRNVISKYKDSNTTGSIVECIIDRINGTLSYVLAGVEKVLVFTDPEFKAGDLYFAVSLLGQDYAFEIVD